MGITTGGGSRLAKAVPPASQGSAATTSPKLAARDGLDRRDVPIVVDVLVDFLVDCLVIMGTPARCAHP
ncbi:MAG TPA: hypothetical protein VGK52_05490 [Polyangia bacterium]